MIGHSFIAGSLTTNVDYNPSFGVIDFDAENMLPVNIYTYRLDLDKANRLGDATWELLHDYLKHYEL